MGASALLHQFSMKLQTEILSMIILRSFNCPLLVYSLSPVDNINPVSRCFSVDSGSLALFKKAKVHDVNLYRVDVNFQTAIVSQIFFILILINIKVLLILHTIFQPNIPIRSGENDDFISFAIFSKGGLLEFSTRLNFTILKPWSLIMLHMKFKIHGCSGLRE